MEEEKKKVLGAGTSATPTLCGLLQPPSIIIFPHFSSTRQAAESIADSRQLVKMFKPSQPMMARLRLTTKQVNGGYYKGTRSGSMGYFAKNGSYVIDWKKVRTYVVPEDLDQFKVREARIRCFSG